MIEYVCGDCETITAEQGLVRAAEGIVCPSCGSDDLWHSSHCPCDVCIETRRITTIQHEQHEEGYRNAKSVRAEMNIVRTFQLLLWWFKRSDAQTDPEVPKAHGLDAAAVVATEVGKSLGDAVTRWLEHERKWGNEP